MKDQSLIEEAAKMQMALRSVDGETIQKLIAELSQAPVDVVEGARSILVNP